MGHLHATLSSKVALEFPRFNMDTRFEMYKKTLNSLGARPRLDPSLGPRQSAVLISALATGPPAGVGGGPGPFLAV